MAREIKFRAWDKDKKRMVKVKSIHFMELESCIVVNPFEFISLEHVEIMQYTGLKDKNGVEIYEGDIIEQQHYFKNYDGTLDEFFKQKKVVGDIRKAIFGLYDVLGNITVIGNRYENPELMEG